MPYFPEPSPGLGFILGGVRGLGSARSARPGVGFSVGYAPMVLKGWDGGQLPSTTPFPGSSGSGSGVSGRGLSSSPNPAASFRFGGGGLIPTSPQSGNTTTNNSSAAAGALTGTAATASPIYHYTQGGEGLPVWILTGGSDGYIRCWDLDRPRASHTVSGIPPCETRDGYEGVTLVSVPPPNAGAAATGGGLGGVVVGGEESDTVDFPAYATPDGFTARAKGRGDTVVVGGGASHGSGYQVTQKGFPVRAILSTPLATLMEESEATSGGLPTSPHREGKGAVPPPTAHTSYITAMTWLDIPSRVLVTGGRDGVLKFWR